MLDASLRVGYALDNILVYGLAGFSQTTAVNFGPGGRREADGTGTHYGIGVAYGLNEMLDVSLQYVTRELTVDGGPGGLDFEAEHDTVSLRAAYRF